MADLPERIVRVLRTHDWWLAGNLGVPGLADATIYKCLCGWNGDDPRGHQADELVDLIVDLAGTGQLLASIDRIARDEAAAG